VLKLIKAERVTSTVAVSEFETEVSVLSRLNHGNVVRYLGSGYVPRRFIVLEFLEGGTLAAALGMHPPDQSKKQAEKRKFTFLQSLSLARALANSMDYLHKQWHNSIAVVHRDLKPDNIGFTANGILKVFDFGLCSCIHIPSSADMKTAYEMTGNTGTLRYMAPEVALGEKYNHTVDVYSFGIIAWQVLKGRIPFEEMNKKMFFDKVVRGKYRPHLDRLWPQNLCALLESCWHDDYRRRPSFGEVIEKLDEIIEENRNYFSCFSFTSGIPVTFSSGVCCIDPEYIAKHRYNFVFGHMVLFMLGIFMMSIRVVAFGVFIVNMALLSLYIFVCTSWEYWPSAKGKSIRWWISNCFCCCVKPYEALDRDPTLNSSTGQAEVGYGIASRSSSPALNPMLHQGISLMSKRATKDGNKGAVFSSVTVEV